jgi:hypothetical protein
VTWRKYEKRRPTGGAFQHSMMLPTKAGLYRDPNRLLSRIIIGSAVQWLAATNSGSRAARSLIACSCSS